MSHASAGRQQATPTRSGHAPADATPQEIITIHARTSFSFAARFLPQPQRDDAIDLYAFFRTLDDLVDTCPPSIDPTSIGIELDAWQSWLDGSRTGPGPREPFAGNLARVIERHAIPVDVFHQMLAGLRADLGPRQVETDSELQTYCFQVASTVGCAMAYVLGATSPQALLAAEKLGAAMQLTNILRDVGEDLDTGRVYLPASLLARYGLCHADLRAMRHDQRGPDDRFRSMMRDQIHYTQALYEQALPGIWLLPERCRLPIFVAARLYRRLLAIIERNAYDTLRRRAATSRLDKAREATICWATVTLRRPIGVSTSTEPLPRGSAIEVQGD